MSVEGGRLDRLNIFNIIDKCVVRGHPADKIFDQWFPEGAWGTFHDLILKFSNDDETSDLTYDDDMFRYDKENLLSILKYHNISTGTKLPSVEVPDPGASYNPSLEDHQDLLWKGRSRHLLE